MRTQRMLLARDLVGMHDNADDFHGMHNFWIMSVSKTGLERMMKQLGEEMFNG